VTAYLLDVNVLVALVRPQQPHHRKATEWFKSIRGSHWATCPLTEAGLVRIASDPQFTTATLNASDVVAMLTELRKLPGHRFWPVDFGFAEATANFEGRFFGHRQVTDLYLLSLAVRHKGTLATFDRGIAALAGTEYAHNLSIL
jgi:toxin-antitoxin system PIN domain toxin